MIKELRRVAGVKKAKNVSCTFYNDAVEFKDHKEVLKRWNIENTQKNQEYRIIVVATKTEKKNRSKIFAMKFPDEPEFLRFYDAINTVPIAPIGKRTPPPTPSIVGVPHKPVIETPVDERSHISDHVPTSGSESIRRTPESTVLRQEPSEISEIRSIASRPLPSKSPESLSASVVINEKPQDRPVSFISPTSRSASTSSFRYRQSQPSRVKSAASCNITTFISSEDLLKVRRAQSVNSMLYYDLNTSQYSSNSDLSSVQDDSESSILTFDEYEPYSLVPSHSRNSYAKSVYENQNKLGRKSRRSSYSSASSMSDRGIISSNLSTVLSEVDVTSETEVAVIVQYVECESCRNTPHSTKSR